MLRRCKPGAFGSTRGLVLVVLVTHTARLGGAELSLLRLCAAVDPTRTAVRVICFEDGPLVAELRRVGITVEILTSAGAWVEKSRGSTGRLSGLVSLGAGSAAHARRVGRRIRELRPDVVQSWTLKAHLVSTIARPIYRRPLVWFLHDRITDDYLGRRNRLVLQALSRMPDAIIANSRATAATLPRARVVAYPGLSPDQFLPADAQHEPPLGPAEILLLGRISPTKGQREAIRAMPRVLASVPDARLRIVGTPLFGEDAYAATCRQLVMQLGLEDSVDFAGFSSDPREDLDRAAVLVHASPTPEPFGQVIAEAMARRVPVIGTDAGGVPELLRDDGQARGLLVPPGNPEALADAIVSVLLDPGAAQARADHAYRFASEHVTIERTAEIVERTWRQVARGQDLRGLRCLAPDG